MFFFFTIDGPDNHPLVYSNVTDQFNEGMAVGLTCELAGGNPIATLTWTCNGKPVTAVDTSVEDTARLELGIVVDKSYYRNELMCTATHPAWREDKFGLLGHGIYVFIVLLYIIVQFKLSNEILFTISLE